MKLITTNLLNRFWVKGVKPAMERLEWKHLANKAGAGSVTIPSGARELSIKANIGVSGSNDIVLTLHLVTGELHEASQSYRTGYYQTSTNGCGAMFNISKSTVAFSNAFVNGETVTDSTSWTVSYR